MTTAPPASNPAYRRHRRPAGWGGRRILALVALGAAATLVATGCTPADATRTKDAPVISVATGLWPVAQAVEAIGQQNVKVVDVVPNGQDPLTYKLDAAERASVSGAALVIDDGDLQPSLDAAAAADPSRTLTLHASNPYVWLNAYTMESVSRSIESALVRADPKATKTFASGLYTFEPSLASIDEDYQNTLDDCPEKTVVAADDAFAVLNSRYPIRVVPLESSPSPAILPSRATVTAEVAVVRHLRAHKVYSETWVSQSALLPVQEQTGITISTTTLDPLLGVPQGGFPKGDGNYSAMMEQNLGVLSGALQCPNPNEQD